MLVLACVITCEITLLHLDYSIQTVETGKGRVDFILALYGIKIDTNPHLLFHGMCMK